MTKVVCEAWLRWKAVFSNQLFGVRNMKTKINTHSTSHCQDVRGYVQKKTLLALAERNPMVQLTLAMIISQTVAFVENANAVPRGAAGLSINRLYGRPRVVKPAPEHRLCDHRAFG